MGPGKPGKPRVPGWPGGPRGPMMDIPASPGAPTRPGIPMAPLFPGSPGLPVGPGGPGGQLQSGDIFGASRRLREWSFHFSSSSWLTRPKIAVSICCSPRSASRRSTRACSSAVRKWASTLRASEQRASATSPHDPGLGSRAQRSARAAASTTVPGTPGSPGPRVPAAAALRVRSANILSLLENQ